MNRRRILATGAAVAFAGCVSYPSDSDEPPSSRALLRDAIETRRHMTDLTARRVMTVETGDETVERTERVALRPPAKQRREVVESTDPDVPAGSVTVTNRTTTWEYNPATETVEKQYHPNKTDTDRTRLVLETLRDDHRLSYRGTETVDGRETHVVETQPPAEDTGPAIGLVVGDTEFLVKLRATSDPEALSATRTVWIDDEYRYPIKERNTTRIDGEVYHELTVTYEDLALDTGLEPGTFTYDPPADATVTTEGVGPDGVFESRSAAEEFAPYDLPEPTVPDSYVLDRITVVETAERFGTTTTLWYTDPNVVARELYVAVKEVQRIDTAALEPIEFDGHTAYRRDGGKRSIFWQCDGLNYEVTCLTDDTPLLEIAASIGCS
ncbi:outer membrane lipoprotein carrier protein LolA [Natrinema pallidum]|nr:outer membrane lipoprotein carrier protein LolA [Natrinema pallidum]QCW04050.1 outer membrane lipoprotein carrier protein LolA [Natrinema pallidum]